MQSSREEWEGGKRRENSSLPPGELLTTAPLERRAGNLSACAKQESLEPPPKEGSGMEPPSLGEVLAVGREMWFFLMSQGARLLQFLATSPCVRCVGAGAEHLSHSPHCAPHPAQPLPAPHPSSSLTSGLVPLLIPVEIHHL